MATRGRDATTTKTTTAVPLLAVRAIAVLVAAAAAAAAWLPAQTAHAAPSVIHLTYEAPDACPDANALGDGLDALLGDAGARGTPLEVDARVVLADDDRYHLALTLNREGAASTRALDSKSCATLIEAAALVIALAHDPEAVQARGDAGADAGAGAGAGVPAPVIPVGPPPMPWTVAPPPKAESAGVPLGFAVRFGPMFGVGDLPDVHPGLEGTLALRIAEYTLEGAFDLGLGAAGTVDAAPDKGADFRLLVGVVRGCRSLYPFFDRPWPRPSLAPELDACVGLELGMMSGSGFGVAHPAEGTALWVAPRIDGRFSLGIAGPLSVGVDLGVAFPVDPRRFVITAGDTLVVHEAAPVAGRAGLAAEIGF